MSYFASMNFHAVKVVEIKPVFGRDPEVILGTQFKIIHDDDDYIEITVFGSESGLIQIIQKDAT